jgi:hypothetical protein
MASWSGWGGRDPTILHLTGLNDMRFTYYHAVRQMRLTDTGGKVMQGVGVCIRMSASPLSASRSPSFPHIDSPRIHGAAILRG